MCSRVHVSRSFAFASDSFQVPREAADKLIFEEESKEKAKKEAKIAEERAEREKAKKGKVFAHLAGTGGSAPADDSAKPPAPPSTEAETAAVAAAAAGGVEERWVTEKRLVEGEGGGGHEVLGREGESGCMLSCSLKGVCCVLRDVSDESRQERRE